MKGIKNIALLFIGLTLTLFLVQGFVMLSESRNKFTINDSGQIEANDPICNINEGFYLGETNNIGCLGPDFIPERKGDTVYVALIGDSFVMGHHLPDAYHYRAILEKKMSEYLGKPCRVYNFGRFGVYLSHMYLQYKHYGLDTLMDYNIFLVTDLTFKKNYATTLRPYLVWEKDTLKEKLSREISTYSRIRRSFSLVSMLSNVPNVLRRKLDRAGVILKDKQERNVSFETPLNQYMIHDITSRSNNIIVLRRSNDRDSLVTANVKDIHHLQAYLDARHLSREDIYYYKVTGENGHFNRKGHEVMAEYLFGLLKPKIAKPFLSQ